MSITGAVTELNKEIERLTKIRDSLLQGSPAGISQPAVSQPAPNQPAPNQVAPGQAAPSQPALGQAGQGAAQRRRPCQGE